MTEKATETPEAPTTPSGEQVGEHPLVMPGAALRLFFNKGNIKNQVIHIRGIVDDHVVFRTWSKRKQRWIYNVESWCWFDVMRDHLSKA